MSSSRFRVQVAAVVAVGVLIGWPQFAPLPQVTVWRAESPLAPDRDLLAQEPEVLPQAAGATRRRGGLTPNTEDDDSTAIAGPTLPGSGPIRGNDELPQSLQEAGARLNAITGRARTVNGDPVRYARLVLRNTSTGLVEARATADQEGRFAFLDVIPSGYVVELIGPDGTVVATSELVAVNNGDLRQATVRVAANSTLRAVFGSTATMLMPTVEETVNRAIQEGARSVTQPSTSVSD